MMDDQSKDTTHRLPRFGVLFIHSLILNIHRFRTLCFWLYAEPSVLDGRLNERVDAMIKVQ